MTNLEFYKDEIVEIKNRDDHRILECVLCDVKNKTYNCRKPCYQCLKESLDWLLEEHKEPIKLKQWEYDLLSVQRLPKEANRFEVFKTYMDMKAKGHFEGVTDISMTVQDILDNCEVVE